MTPEQFAYWLQGCAELNPDMETPSPAQWKAIKEHLASVFVKVTPPVRHEGPMVAAPYRQPSHEESLREIQRQTMFPGLGSPYQITC